MSTLELKYGKRTISVNYDGAEFDVLGSSRTERPLSDAEIGKRFDEPIDSETIEEIVSPGDSVLIVVPDATREIACGQIVNLLVRRLIANGTQPSDIRIIFAPGMHRPVTPDEKQKILTPFIAQRINTLEHNARDIASIVNLGETSAGIPIELNRALVEHDRVILVGGASFHYFAGFTGGRKLICPGLASSRTTRQTHALAFDCEKLSRRLGVDTGILDGNPVHEAFMEAAAAVNPAFAVTTLVDDMGLATDVFCGNWKTSHRAACDRLLFKNSVTIPEKRTLVIASCGGYPHDIDLIQAHKALDAASRACVEGGQILLLAECSEGSGRQAFFDWFDSETSRTLAQKLCEKYQVNGQTAWSILTKAERFNISMVTSLDEASVNKMRMKKIGENEIAAFLKDNAAKSYVLPTGAKTLVCS